MAVEEPTLVVSEVFGPTLAGEGVSLGRRCSFVRLMGCNLACKWCDSAYTWDATRFDLRAEGTRMPVSAIVNRVLQGSPGLVVISGGEPLLHQRQPGWLAMLDVLVAAGVDIEVETNGTVAPTDATAIRVTRFTASPKLAHGGDEAAARIVPAVLARFTELAGTGAAVFKFVVDTVDDIVEVQELVQAYDLPSDAVWVMPMGTTATVLGQRIGQLADAAVAAGFNMTTRLHVIAWGDERGR